MGTLNRVLQHTLSSAVHSGTLSQFSPEPKGNSSTFGSFMSGLGSVARSVIGVDPEYQTLIETQMYLQEQMQRVSMISNIERSRHESKMAAIRNIRTG